ncbi:MAG TPA: hypothetical protein EYQ00_05525 [Dehalococcoidia bacterium]|jgi:tetratricopeptide (TPR) repeat protein|nr:hypothetical protein [Dehalococcoidia bacterium]
MANLDPNTLLRVAMQLHAAGDISTAVEQVREIVADHPEFAAGYSYLGQTLVTRQRKFNEGLDYLRRAVKSDPQDAYILYTAGWCSEYVANALERPKFSYQAPAETPQELYKRARMLFFEALAVLREEPDDALKGDVEDMLDVIARATGEPWDEELREYAPPRIR